MFKEVAGVRSTRRQREGEDPPMNNPLEKKWGLLMGGIRSYA